jgi:hypothetical protein
MREHLHYDDDQVINVETHHEESDVNVKALLWFVFFFIVFAFITHGVVYFMFRQLVTRTTKAQAPPLTSIAHPPGAGVPVLPRLQPFSTETNPYPAPQLSPVAETPVADMIRMREAEDRVLDHYGWVDKQKGIVHIPIDEAKKLVLRQGLPVNAGPSTPPMTTTATETTGTAVPPVAVPAAAGTTTGAPNQ